MAEMPQVYMPDPDNLPNGLKLSPAVVTRYQDTLPDMYFACWDSFGVTGETNPPEAPDISDISGEERSNIASYVSKVAALRAKTEFLRDADLKQLVYIQEAAEQSRLGQEAIGGSIQILHDLATVNPADTVGLEAALSSGQLPLTITIGSDGQVSEDDYVSSLIDFAVDDVEATMKEATGVFEELAAKVEAAKPAQAPPEKEGGEESPRGQNYVPPGGPFQWENPAAQNPSRADTLDAPPPWEWNSGTDTDLGTGAAQAGDRALLGNRGDVTAQDRAAIDQTTGGAGQSDDDSGVTGATGAAEMQPASAIGGSYTPSESSSGTGDMSSYLLPGLIGQMMNGTGGSTAGSAAEPRERHGRGERTGRSTAAPAAAAPAGSATPQQGTQNGSQQQSRTGAPARTAQAVSAPGTTPPPPRAETPAGNMIFTFPDGRTQEVSVVVGRALQAALDNRVRTDAREAYSKTPITWNDDQTIGRRIDPSQLMTGDIATWSDATAVTAVFETDGHKSLEVIVDGELRPFAEDISSSRGGFGRFSGFQHPAGIEKMQPGHSELAPAHAAETVPA